jgi:hypothetical protein
MTALFLAVSFSNCAASPQNTYSLKNTLAIFLLNDGKNYFFSLPVMYVGDYHINNFEFDNGYILIGDYKLPLNRNDITIDAYVNVNSDEYGNADGEHKIVYSEKNGGVSISKMEESLTKNDDKFYQYNIFIEKKLNKNELININNEYEKGNTYSEFERWYKAKLGQEEQGLYGIYDDFEIYNGISQELQIFDTDQYPPVFEFFRSKVLLK